MKERVIYNTYYEHFDVFREAVLGFFALLSNATPESAIKQALRSRVRDKFSPIQARSPTLEVFWYILVPLESCK
jgi:hypothetical protein